MKRFWVEKRRDSQGIFLTNCLPLTLGFYLCTQWPHLMHITTKIYKKYDSYVLLLDHSTPLWNGDSAFCISFINSPIIDWYDISSPKPPTKMSPKIGFSLSLARCHRTLVIVEDFWRHLPRVKHRQNPLQSSVVKVSVELLAVEGHPRNSKKKYGSSEFWFLVWVLVAGAGACAVVVGGGEGKQDI